MAILADYTGIYHSTTEILQVYAEESSFIEEKYNLGMNDTEYIRDLMIKVGDICRGSTSRGRGHRRRS